MKNNLECKRLLQDGALQDINRKLLSTVEDSIAPKAINEIFVLPILSTDPEGVGAEINSPSKSDEIILDELLNSSTNLMFIGKKEAGKTTIIHYACNYFLNKLDNMRIPVIIDFADFPKGKNPIHKAISNFLLSYNISNINVDENIKRGNFILLIDNFHISNSRNNLNLKEFCESNTSTRIILTVSEDILQTIKIKELPDLGFKYNHYYIYSLRRGQIRQLVKKWFCKKNINDDVLLERVMHSITSIGLPRNPFVVSLLLWGLEKEAGFNPVNEAALVENFIQALLEKLNPEEARYDKHGYSVKQDFLIHLALNLTKNEKVSLEKTEFEEFHVKYFKEIGREVSDEFKYALFIRGILIEYNGRVFFRFRCFAEYFVAKGMLDNPDVYDYFLSEDQYLKYFNEIVYLAGLDQKRLSYQTLKVIEKRLLDSFKECDEIVEIEELGNYPVRSLICESFKDENVAQKLQELKLRDEEKDRILDGRDDHNVSDLSIKNQQENQQEVKDVSRRDFLTNLALYSNILKNCELVKLVSKVEALQICIDKYCKLVGIFYKILYTAIHEEKQKKELEEMDERMIYMLTVGMPFAMQGMLLSNLGTPQLRAAIETLLDKSITEFEKLMLVSLYGDLRIEGYISKFVNLLNQTQSKLVKEIVFSKLFYYQMFYKLTKKEETQITEAFQVYLETETSYLTEGVDNNQKKNIIRSRVKQGIKAKLLMAKMNSVKIN